MAKKWEKMSTDQKIDSLADSFNEADEEIAYLKATIDDLARTVNKNARVLAALSEHVQALEQKVKR